MSFFSRFFRKKTEFSPEKAYDIWAAAYDDQPGNLMLDLDAELFRQWLAAADLKKQFVIDYGCGTGRHWNALYQQQPAVLCGYDVSSGMLQQLRNKFPEAAAYQLRDIYMKEMENASAGFLISTLTIAHIEDPGPVFAEWNRVLKPGGQIWLTDYHPAVLARGGKRTFSSAGKTISVKNQVHTVEQIRSWAGEQAWVETGFAEEILDESLRHYYAAQNALAVYEQFKGQPLIYGIAFKKAI